MLCHLNFGRWYIIGNSTTCIQIIRFICNSFANRNSGASCRCEAESGTHSLSIRRQKFRLKRSPLVREWWASLSRDGSTQSQTLTHHSCTHTYMPTSNSNIRRKSTDATVVTAYYSVLRFKHIHGYTVKIVEAVWHKHQSPLSRLYINENKNTQPIKPNLAVNCGSL